MTELNIGDIFLILMTIEGIAFGCIIHWQWKTYVGIIKELEAEIKELKANQK